MSNTALWDKLGKTDPAHTKQFKRAGGFSGTAIKPMWAYKRMTEEFGPCGKGWGIGEPSFQVVPGPEGEMLVYCTASIWYVAADESGPHTVYGVGGDKAVGKNKYGLASDDEAFKKAFTDAITNALKMIGVGADVHMGLFDDSKYVNEVGNEFREVEEAKAKSSAQLKREGEWERVSKEIADAMNDVTTFGQFESLKAEYREEARKNGWNKAFTAQLKDLFEHYEGELQSRIAAENDETVGDIQDEFPGARVARDQREQYILEAGE